MLPYINDLVRGSKGKEVESLQKRLIELGYKKVFNSKGLLKTLEADGDFGEITEIALTSFQAKVYDFTLELNLPSSITGMFKDPLIVDGVMNYVDWYVLENFEHLNELVGMYYKKNFPPIEEIKILDKDSLKDTLRKTFLQKLIEKLGCKETKPYNNTSPCVNEIIKIGSFGELKHGGVPWCKAYTNVGEILTCEQWDLRYKGNKSLYTPDGVIWGVNKKIAIKYPNSDEIEFGTLGYVHSSSRGGSVIQSVQHIYAIEKKLNSSTVITLEGNTNDMGGSDGYISCRRQRKISTIKAYVDLWQAYM